MIKVPIRSGVPSKSEYESTRYANRRPNRSLFTRSRFRAKLLLATAADALQMVVFPLFTEGTCSPADDMLEVAVAATLVHPPGRHWEFLTTFSAELVPGVDLL
jgi:hypothetical protein